MRWSIHASNVRRSHHCQSKPKTYLSSSFQVVTADIQNQGRIFLAGPPLVKAATGEIVDEETLGGGEMHTAVSGVADHLALNDGHAIRLAREAVKDLGGNRKSVCHLSYTSMSI